MSLRARSRRPLDSVGDRRLGGVDCRGRNVRWIIRPDRDPDRLWRTVHDELRAGGSIGAESSMRRLLELRPATEDDWFTMAQIAMGQGRTTMLLTTCSRYRTLCDGRPGAALGGTARVAPEPRSRGRIVAAAAPSSSIPA